MKKYIYTCINSLNLKASSAYIFFGWLAFKKIIHMQILLPIYKGLHRLKNIFYLTSMDGGKKYAMKYLCFVLDSIRHSTAYTEILVKLILAIVLTPLPRDRREL